MALLGKLNKHPSSNLKELEMNFKTMTSEKPDKNNILAALKATLSLSAKNQRAKLCAKNTQNGFKKIYGVTLHHTS